MRDESYNPSNYDLPNITTEKLFYFQVSIDGSQGDLNHVTSWLKQCRSASANKAQMQNTFKGGLVFALDHRDWDGFKTTITADICSRWECKEETLFPEGNKVIIFVADAQLPAFISHISRHYERVLTFQRQQQRPIGY